MSMLFGQTPTWLLGILGLGIIWVNALLIAAAALSEARRLMKLSAGLGAIRRGTVKSETLAVHEIDQVGRALDAPLPAMLWHDRSFASRIEGGEIEVAGETVTIEASSDGEVWPPRARQIESARCAGDDAFDAQYKSSRGAKGAHRKVKTAIGAGDVIFVARGGKLLSAIDPSAWIQGRVFVSVFFALAELAVCAALTAVALREPHFGLVSTLGGASLLLFFIFVQPIGVAVEDANRSPSERFLNGEWHRSAPPPAGALEKRAQKPAAT